ncbi:phospholipase A [Massilia sp. CFBP9012]|uniref:phospholipase A n=1 Tax=Massilia sp. CFBP9012 TaxID=3096531 RepID=UPI002A6A2329|nr:phospholipase A [Massilia sp. CFBP9012]MDY0978246.1 phospholipase A [Massilia sp. CFBP9012]
MHAYRPRLPHTIALIPLLLALPALAQTAPQTLAECAAIADGSGRLACFDGVVASQAVSAAGTGPATAAVTTPTTPAAVPPVPTTAPIAEGAFDAPRTSALDRTASVDPVVQAAAQYTLSSHWELDSRDKRGVFKFRPHHPSYLIATRTHRPNEEPYRDFWEADPDAEGLSKAELEFQLSFKMKLVETLFELPVDVWFGYTQNSFWQAANHEASSPFRETNYQPEVMVVTPLDYALAGVNVRFLNLGFVHQSNGQSSTLSRSWNRFYAQVGLERGPLSMTVKAWKRVNESAEDDNNPDITDYMGRFEVAGNYRLNGGHELSALVRRNFSTDKGAVQVGWAFPLAGPVKGYINAFAGYGQSMIDYNYFQRSVGAGVIVKY